MKGQSSNRSETAWWRVEKNMNLSFRSGIWSNFPIWDFKRHEALFHYPSPVLFDTRLNMVPLLEMCLFRLMHSDMQSGTNPLLRRHKGRQSECQILLPWTKSWGPWMVVQRCGGGCMCVWEWEIMLARLKYRGRCALVCLYMRVCECLHKQLKASSDTILSLLCFQSQHKPHKAEHLKQGGKEGVWLYCGALSWLMTPGTRSPTGG